MVQNWFGFQISCIDFLVVSQEMKGTKTRHSAQNVCLGEGVNLSWERELWGQPRKRKKERNLYSCWPDGQQAFLPKSKSQTLPWVWDQRFQLVEAAPACLPPRSVMLMREGEGGDEDDTGKAPGGDVSPEPHGSPRVPLPRPERAAGIIRKSGERKAGLAVCCLGGALHGAWGRQCSIQVHPPVSLSRATPALRKCRRSGNQIGQEGDTREVAQGRKCKK